MVVKQAAARSGTQSHRPTAFESGGAAIPKEKLTAMLAKYDTNGDGQIVRGELKIIMQEMIGADGEAVTDGEVNELVRKADLHNDGKLNESEMVSAM